MKIVFLLSVLLQAAKGAHLLMEGPRKHDMHLDQKYQCQKLLNKLRSNRMLFIAQLPNGGSPIFLLHCIQSPRGDNLNLLLFITQSPKRDMLSLLRKYEIHEN
jgi:hypothetical protein